MKKFLCVMMASALVMAMASVVFAGSIKGSLPNTEVGNWYGADLEYEGVFGGYYDWSISDGKLPDGLELPGTHMFYQSIWGTPTRAGTFNFSVTVVVTEGAGMYGDVLDTVTRDFTIVVTGDAPSTPRISGTLPEGSRNVPYSSTLRASNGGAPYTWSYSGTLPDGLEFRGNQTDTTGNEYILSGTPYTDGSYNFTVTVTDTYGGQDKKTFTVVIGNSGSSGNSGNTGTTTGNSENTTGQTTNNQNTGSSGGGGGGSGCDMGGSISALIFVLAGVFFGQVRKEEL
ncbi:MAG: putative Ig domain-containing protein [Synergistaceae bacterium]|nr:putative Ig domain-containing protein [Synergistaceae bacterium]